MDPSAQLQQQIADYRAAITARRARSYIDCPDRVLGLSVPPLVTPTWTMLQATNSAFLRGDTPLEGDVRNYLWFHSRLYMHRAWWTVPTFAKWIALFRFNVILRRKRDVHWYAATIALASAEISGLIADALADAPAPGRSCAPGPCLQAQFDHFGAKEYGWPLERTRRVPLRQLFQLVRAASNGDDDDEGERRIRFAHLRRRNDELAAARAAKAADKPPPSNPVVSPAPSAL